MRYIDFLVLFAHTQCKSHLVFDYQLSLLKPSNGSANFLKFIATYTKLILDNLVINSLLLHNERILSIGIKVKSFALETTHILCGKNDA